MSSQRETQLSSRSRSKEVQGPYSRICAGRVRAVNETGEEKPFAPSLGSDSRLSPPRLRNLPTHDEQDYHDQADQRYRVSHCDLRLNVSDSDKKDQRDGHAQGCQREERSLGINRCQQSFHSSPLRRSAVTVSVYPR